jgi:hypothetical protein
MDALSSGSWLPGTSTTGTSAPRSASNVRAITRRSSWFVSNTSPQTTMNAAARSRASSPMRASASKRLSV